MEDAARILSICEPTPAPNDNNWKLNVLQDPNLQKRENLCLQLAVLLIPTKTLSISFSKETVLTAEYTIQCKNNAGFKF